MGDREPTAPCRNLVLIGGRGCGKSAISRRLVRREKRFTLLSLDALIRYESQGRPIPEIVAEHGWPGFRDIEYEVVRKASAFPAGALLDCGGGVVVDVDASGHEVYSERKVEALRRNGLVVYLQRETEYLLDRIHGDAERPALSETESFEESIARRDPWYRRAADWVFECSDLDKTRITAQVLDWFRAQCETAEAADEGRGHES